MQLLEHRAYIERRERDHQKELDKQQMDIERQMRLQSDLIGKIIKEAKEGKENVLIKRLFDIAEEIKGEHKREKEQIKASFYRSLEQIKEEFANEITLTTETLQAKHKKDMGMIFFFL